MPDRQFRPNLEEAALLTFDDAAASGQDYKTALKTAVTRYPECAALLAAHAMTLQGADRVSAAEADALSERVNARADALLSARLAAEPTAIPQRGDLVSLFAAIGQRGVGKASLAASLSIDMTVLTKLNQRLIDIYTIPRKLVDGLAAALDITSAELWHYLAKPPTLAARGEYKSPDNPTLPSDGETESFAKALATAVRSNEDTKADLESWRDAGPVGPPDGD